MISLWGIRDKSPALKHLEPLAVLHIEDIPDTHEVIVQCPVCGTIYATNKTECPGCDLPLIYPRADW